MYVNFNYIYFQILSWDPVDLFFDIVLGMLDIFYELAEFFPDPTDVALENRVGLVILLFIYSRVYKKHRRIAKFFRFIIIVESFVACEYFLLFTFYDFWDQFALV
jgi:hypothetical protein